MARIESVVPNWMIVARPARLGTLLGLLGLLGLAFWLRWGYLQRVGLFVDEYNTLWLAKRTLEAGVPLMLSDTLAPRGLLNSYLLVPFMAFSDTIRTAGRLPSLICGLGTVLVVLAVGRGGWNRRVGWLAALGIVLLPEAIEASSRARFYGPLLLCIAPTIWFAFRSAQPPDPIHPWRAPLGFVLFFGLALFSQEQTLLLYPPLLLGIVLWRGWRASLRPPLLVAHLLCLGLIAARFGVEALLQTTYAERIQDEKPYLTLAIEIGTAWEVYRDLLIPGPRWLLSLAALIGVGAALERLVAHRGRVAHLSHSHQATLFFALPFATVLALLLTVADWREERYLWMMQPCWLLLGAAGATWLADRLSSHPTARTLSMGVLLMLMLVGFWPLAQKVLGTQAEGYEEAFQYVAATRQPGDVVMTLHPYICGIVLGEPCDFYARQRGFEPYVVPRTGGLVDRWTGAPLLESAESFEAVLRRGNRVWIVADGHSLGERYRDPWIQTVAEQFEVAFESRGVRALLSTGWEPLPPAAVSQRYDPPRPFEVLALSHWEYGTPTPGAPFNVMLFWKVSRFSAEPISTSVHLVAADTLRISQTDGPPARGIITPADDSNALLPDRKTLALPADLPDGRYRLEVTVYNASSQIPFGPAFPFAWFRVGPPPPEPEVAAPVAWANGLTLVGHDRLPDQLQPATPLTVRLVWTTRERLPQDLTGFVHLVGPDGTLVAQSDLPPEGGFYPTTAWEPETRVAEQHQLTLPEALAPGQYRLFTGWYHLPTGERAGVAGGGDAWELGQFTVP